MNTVISCLCVFAIAVTIPQDAESFAKEMYNFPSNCTCQYKNLNGAENCSNPTSYPDNQDLGLEDECLPSVPEK